MPVVFRGNVSSMKAPSIRSIAKQLGLSRSTVSDALSGKARVAQETRQRVLAYAKEAGYEASNDISDMMSKIRSSKTQSVCRQVAVLDIGGYLGVSHQGSPYHRELYKGILDGAEQMNLEIHLLCLPDDPLDIIALNTQLDALNTDAVIVLPAAKPPCLRGIDWDRYSAIYTDYLILEPALDCISPNHFKSMFHLVEELAERGYQRIGLAIDREGDHRILLRWESACQISVKYSDIQYTEPLFLGDCTEEKFRIWFEREKPDVVVSHQLRVMDWMLQWGARIPETHGFCSLNLTMTGYGMAGIDQNPWVVGQRAVEILTSNMLANRKGVPEIQLASTINASWVDGPTIRPRSRKTKQAS